MRMFFAVPVVSACLLAAACQSRQPEQAAAAPPPAPPYSTSATVKDIMLGIVDPAGDLIWNSVATVIDKAGTHETTPKSDEEWAKVHSGVIMLMEGANALMIPGRHVARPGEKSETPGVELEPSEMEELINKDRAAWYMRAKRLHDVAESVLPIIEAKDAQKLFDVGEEIDQACENCHRQYWYPNEKIPDVPSGPLPTTPPAPAK